MQSLNKILDHLHSLGYEIQDYLASLQEEQELEQEVEVEVLEAEGLAEEERVFLAESHGIPSEIMILVFQKTQKTVLRVNLDPHQCPLDRQEQLEVFNLLNDAVRGGPKIFYDTDRDEIAIETLWFGNFYRPRVFQRFFEELQEFCALALGKLYLEPDRSESAAERLERLFQMDYQPGNENPGDEDVGRNA